MEINKDVIEYAKIVDELYNTYATDVSKQAEELQDLWQDLGPDGALSKLIVLFQDAINKKNDLSQLKEALLKLASYSVAGVIKVNEAIKDDINAEVKAQQKYFENFRRE